MRFILSLISLFIFGLVYILAEITGLFIDVRNRKWYKTTSKRKFTKAFKVDAPNLKI